MHLPGVKNILVLELGGIGDCLIALPAIVALRDAYPGCRVDCMAFARTQELASVSGAFNDILVVGRGALRDLGTVIDARRRHYDLVINMRPIVSRIAAGKICALMAAIGGRIWAGRNTAGLGKFFAVSIDEPLRALHYDQEYVGRLFRVLGVPVADRYAAFPFPVGAREDVVERLRDAGVSEESRVVGIHPGGLPSHRWPIERFAAVMRTLAAATGCVFVLTGDRRERRYCDRLMTRAGVRAVNLAGALTIRELGALLHYVALYITNDTGPMHIAAALGRPLIAIFGPGDFLRFDPRAVNGRVAVLYKRLPCAPCDRKRCVSRRCLAAIGVEEVSGEALRMLRTAK